MVAIALAIATLLFFIMCDLSNICHQVKRIADHMTKESEDGDE